MTTNFDNLVSDGLSIHSSRFPIVVGHDALAQYAAVELRRPLVAKVHGALGFAPKNHPDDIAELPKGWRIALQRIFERYTPIVIGYEGNDGSLMGFLQSLPEHVPDRVLWCVYAPDAKPKDCLDRVSPEVRDYVSTRRGRLIPIRGFDELMAKLLTRLRERGSVPDLYERLKERTRERERSYDEQQRKLFESSLSTPPGDDRKLTPGTADLALNEALSEIAETRKDKPWWVWTQEASRAPDSDTKDAILLRALEAQPKSPDLLKSYALFLEQERKDMNSAEQFYQRAIEADPKHAVGLAFYADFLEVRRNDPARAEEYYRRAIEADPNDEYILTRYALYLEEFRREMDAAEEYYKRAVTMRPTYEYSLVSYASFLERVRKDKNRAEEYYLRAVNADPKNAFNLRRYAAFLRSLGRNTEADEYERRTQAVDSRKAEAEGREP